MSSVYDGGPMITAGIVISKDPEYGMNSGIYRFMVKNRNVTGIDIVTPNNMRLYAQRAYEAGRPLEISISIGNHPYEIMGSGFRAPLGMDEMAIAGGIRGLPVDLGKGQTVDVPHIAGSEIVLEAEILPTGWTHPEGRFGEFTRLMGGLHWNPLVRVKSILRRSDAMYYALHMPWENTWLAAPTRYTAIRQALKTAGINIHDINVTLGGCAFWHAVISIKKQAGEGKNALLAALSVMDLKHVVIVDDDIDVFNPMDVEWAIATRVQGDRDVVVIPGARGKPLDPSLPPTPVGVVPTTAKVGDRRHHRRGYPERALRTHRLCLRRHRQDRRLCRRQGRPQRPGRRRRRGRGPGREDRRPDRQDAHLLPGRGRGVFPTTRFRSWRARWAICTRRTVSGRTRAGGCACATPNMRRNRRRRSDIRAFRGAGSTERKGPMRGGEDTKDDDCGHAATGGCRCRCLGAAIRADDVPNVTGK
jgi:hypothetical protein